MAEAPPAPALFLKPASSVIGPGDAIVLPRGAGRVDYEGELVAVIGRVCRGVGAGDAIRSAPARNWSPVPGTGEMGCE